MMQRMLEQVTTFVDFTRGTDLNEYLKQTYSNNRSCKNNLSDVRVSPDGRHIHVILRKPKVGLMTFDKYQRPQQIQSQKHLDLGLTRAVPIVDIVYFDDKNRDGGVALLAVIFENGKAEFWKFLELKGGWHPLHTADLCNSPRAKVISVSASQNYIFWCEERPPSESSSPINETHNFRYCICKRTYEVEEMAVSLGGMKIALHNNPRYNVISSGENVYLLPDLKDKSTMSLSKFFLMWSPQYDTFRVSSTCKGNLLRKDSPSTKESDFRRLITDCTGYLSALSPPDIYGYSPTGSGGLLLLLSTGWVSLLQKDGVLRQIYKLADNCLASSSAHNSLNMYQDTLALTIGRTLYLIDTTCGVELEKIALKREGLLYVNRTERQAPHLLLETGLFVVMLREGDPRGHDSDPKQKTPSLGTGESISPAALLVEAVFEEACKYYQQRSLSSTRLTVEKLKRGGMFQAPITLANIVGDYLQSGGERGVELPQGEGRRGQEKLLGSLEAELKGLVSLEEVKGGLVKEREVEDVCESLVQQEVGRLLLSSELDRDSLLYLNSIFSLFPGQAWRATQSALQLRCNGESFLSSKVPPEVWKTVLSPVQAPTVTVNLPYTNGNSQSKHKSPKPCPSTGSSFKLNPSLSSNSSPLAANSALPVFELLCHSVFCFQPSWLPRFLELAQQQQTSSGLGMGLGLGGSTWSYSGGRGFAENGESLPLYKRALSALPLPGPGSDLKQYPDYEQNQDLEVDLLLVSGRPNAVLQALRILMGRRQWERVTQVAQRFCRQSPLLNKEIFTTLLCEVAQHRDLDPYLDLLWALCPEDLTVTAILNIVLKNIPSSSSLSTSFSPSSNIPPSSPFADPQSSQLTFGLLKPLLSKVLQRETRPNQRYADILQSPSFPPPTPPRRAKGLPRSTTEPSIGLDQQHNDVIGNMAAILDQHDPSKHRTVPGGMVTSTPNPD
ncbi:Hermansky-Pudlak syndrome 6 protein isoform X1 [Salmo salar]|uniref:Hermansky-Pudlak syndrome 6 protein isoform X1 n=2 Tax=Salmo salar TaxID=8030 RepID=A0A1S3RQ93_SALSA|nr:Hermansky-Pudlak syndrome 6 protein isoform X1 [Salmo salar]|eukprot:XP_014054496.1 PREDICTED: Hermansky-Pudlak syndrome 6 protein [Salmo salar]